MFSSIIATYGSNLFLQSSHLLLVVDMLVLNRHDLNEFLDVTAPVVEHLLGQFGTGAEVVTTDEVVQLVAGCLVFHERQFHHVHIAEVIERMVGVPYIGYTSTHTCGEVAACLSEYHDATTGHVLAAMVACTFDDGNGTAVADGKALAYPTADVDLTARGAIKQRVAGDDVLRSVEFRVAWWIKAEASARETLAHVVVGLTFERERDALHEEGTERLTGRAFEMDVDATIGQTFAAIVTGNLT